MTVYSAKEHKVTEGNRYIFGFLIALELFMSFSFLGYIHIEPISMTFSYIPVLIAGCVLGPKESTITGTVFGLASMWKASALYVTRGDAIFSPFMSGKPVASILMSVVARALFGFLVGVLYKLAKKSRFPKTGIVLVTTVGRAIHTFCVYLFMGVFFPEMGHTVADTLQETLQPDYLLFIVIVDSVVLLAYLFSRSGYMRNFISHIQSVDQMDIDRASRRRKMNLLFVLVIIAAVSVAVYFTNRIGRVMENYGLAWSTEMSYDLIHLQIQFLFGVISLAMLVIIVLTMNQKNSIYLYYEARLDGLTGLYSRQQFFQRGEEILRQMEYGRNGIGGCFLILDVDDFKEINDQYGHPVGDKVLKAVASGMENTVGNHGIIGRLGGDEFVALVAEPFSQKEIENLLDRMKKNIAEKLADEEPVTFSVGVIPAEKQYNIDELYRNADRLLYEAKKHGKNRTAFGYRFRGTD